jgi:hypothetical protein
MTSVLDDVMESVKV